MINTLKNWYKNQLIRKKLYMAFIPLIVLPLCIVVLIADSVYSGAAIEKTEQNISDSSRLIVNQLDMLMESAESCSVMLNLNINNVYLLLKYEQDKRIKELKIQNGINNQLSFALNMFPEIESIAFLDTNQRILSTDKRLENNFNVPETKDIMKIMELTSPYYQWFPMQRRDFLTTDSTAPVVTLVRRIVDIETQDSLGIVALNIREDTIAAIYRNLGPLRKGRFFVIDQSKAVVSSENKDELMKPVTEKSIQKLALDSDLYSRITDENKQKRLITEYRVDRLGWVLVSITDMQDIIAENRMLTKYILIVGLVCLVLAIASASLLSGLIVNPIQRLKKEMLKVKKGSLEVSCEVESEDEVGLLASVFNTMIERIKQLLEDIKQEQQKKREYEFALIQSQIKPHFLYNTLDLIYVLCNMGRSKEACDTTKSLADFYRGALSNGKEIITIEDEIKNVHNYLLIQRARYSDVFDFYIEVNDEVYKYCIPKLSIQPLVENSIYHGLKPKRCFGIITIQGFKEGDKIILKVIDDGIGIDGSRLEAILCQEKGSQASGSFGLRSIDERIKLYFGNTYGISIGGETGKGTVTTITLPAQEKFRLSE